MTYMPPLVPAPPSPWSALPRLRLALPLAINWQWVAIAVLSLVVLWDNRGVLSYFWTDVPAIKAGHRHRVDVCGAEADGFDAAGNIIAAGGKVEDALAALQQTSVTERQAAFLKKFSPPFADLVAAGSEPKDAATRAEYAQMFHDFATGLRRRWWFW